MPFVSYKVVFVLIALFATYLPDIDVSSSKLGKKWIFRPLQLFVKHRGIFNSFTFLIAITFIFLMLVPILALGFFLGYGFHLFADCFTKEGIMPFYPWKKKSCGIIRTGGRFETSIFLIFLIFDFLMIIKYVFD